MTSDDDRTPSVDDRHSRPPGTSDSTVEAVGKVSEALEAVEHARGHLYAFHRLMGRADLTLGEAVGLLRDAGHPAAADRLDTEVVGRNVLAGRWTFQIMEEFDDGYYAAFRDHERLVREELMAGRRHVFEAEMKERERTRDRAGHEATPSSG
ncbi:MAG: hypothetical protein ACRCSN_18415 [Dermatophilaceae bacterium]